MTQQVSELQTTLGLNLLKSQMATDAAQATKMMESLSETNSIASHPYKGSSVDVKA
ncbi:polyribonucleotide nucleotidyltransferase [Bacillus fonticola]|uniref:polyribonucleotide nucleotidyltransferase n=1 Tax=Bacillus fonticola TaxID=2728853 RepID=UPI001D15BE8B|nr:polyribonucleotide nucleotidyltransferase [Bacillus fonticola]